ncbi:MAG: DUF4230 domain-containing protein [Prevotella sp.]|uniref:DUF4230 domain-containing protein n=1 Tax=Prevotella sp. AGR2160 TaxID=1280674 RepID=UPI0004166BDF|nr:DUF4230 domain-containing protein [Prevotella sp. AGR2160]MDD5862268.1 DUF4230 domain-containing protein [Prevotella sp.]
MKQVKKTLQLYTAIAIAVCAAIGMLWWINRDNHIETASETTTTLSPTIIGKIEDIGEWEFLSISDEELVDTTRTSFWGDSHLARIYYGTLHIGIDTHDLKAGWIRQNGDTVIVNLPQVHLLDPNFIDEARTKSFYETGSWTEADRQALYRKACEKMKARCLTKENLRQARENMQSQMDKMLRALGFENIVMK